MPNPPLIAIVDNDPNVLASLSDLLESAAYDTRTFISVASFLTAGFEGVDLLITDIGMPGLDGFELRDAVRNANPDLPVLLITGRHEIVDEERAKGAGGFLRKPFDWDRLVSVVQGTLASGQA